MSRVCSPLRYPGGKSCLLVLVAEILRRNKLERGHYVEPYAGGCGLAFSLLYGGYVSDIHINDLDFSIWSFWKSVLENTDAMVELIQTTPVTVDEWHHQKEIHDSSNASDVLRLGFSTFFLNRTNRSGIIKRAGVIGGFAQDGNYKIDCRFNKVELIKRIKRVSKYKSRIHLSNLDAIPFIKQSSNYLPGNTFFCIDPPYFKKGSCLYTNFYGPEEHVNVAETVLHLAHPWIVTYDNVNEIRTIYRARRQFVFDINYSIETKRVISELMIASKGLRLPDEIKDRQTNKPRSVKHLNASCQ